MKRVSSGELEATELYDLETDPSEKYERLKQHPEIANQLLKEAQDFYNELETNRRPVGKIKTNQK